MMVKESIVEPYEVGFRKLTRNVLDYVTFPFFFFVLYMPNKFGGNSHCLLKILPLFQTSSCSSISLYSAHLIELAFSLCHSPCSFDYLGLFALSTCEKQ